MKPTRRPPGRPRLDDTDESETVTFRMPSRDVEDLHRRAAGERISVADFIRRELDKRTQK